MNLITSPSQDARYANAAPFGAGDFDQLKGKARKHQRWDKIVRSAPDSPGWRWSQPLQKGDVVLDVRR